MSRVPTQGQHRVLMALGSGAAGLSFTRRKCEPLLHHGWVTATLHGSYYQFVRITPDGLRALALSVEKFGLPDLGPKPHREAQVCSECGREWRPRCKCGSRTYRFESVEVEALA